MFVFIRRDPGKGPQARVRFNPSALTLLRSHAHTSLVQFAGSPEGELLGHLRQFRREVGDGLATKNTKRHQKDRGSARH